MTIAVWWIAILVISRSYSSSLTSLLAVRKVPSKYEYLTDLIQDDNMKLIYEKAAVLINFISVKREISFTLGSEIHYFLQKAESGIFKELSNANNAGRGIFLASSLLYDAAYNEVRRDSYALLVEDITCRKVFSDDFTNYGLLITFIIIYSSIILFFNRKM